MNVPYVLYGHVRSGSCIIECTLAEAGASYETRDVSLDTEEQRSTAYRNVNPQRKLPTLVTPEGGTLARLLI